MYKAVAFVGWSRKLCQRRLYEIDTPSATNQALLDSARRMSSGCCAHRRITPACLRAALPLQLLAVLTVAPRWWRKRGLVCEGACGSSDAPRGRAKNNGLCVRSLGLAAGACAAIVAAYYMIKSPSAKENGVVAEGKRKESWRDQLSVTHAIFLAVPASVSGCLPVFLDESLSQCLCTQCLSARDAYSHVYVYHSPHAAELGRPKL